MLANIFSKEKIKAFSQELFILSGVFVVCIYTVLALYIFTPLAFVFIVPLLIVVLFLLPRTHRYPEKILRSLILVYFPLTIVWPYYIGINSGFMDLHPSRILLFILLFFWVFYFVTCPNFRSQFLQYKKVSSGFLIVLSLYFFSHISGIGFSPHVAVSLNGIFKIIIEVYVPAILLLILINRRETIENVINVLIAVGFVVALIGTWEFFAQKPFWSSFFPSLVLNDAISDSGIWRYGVYRVASIFAHPLSMVHFQVIALALMGYRLFSTNSLNIKLSMFFLMAGTIFVMFESDSRSIMPALFIMFFILLSAIAFKIFQSKKTSFVGWLFTALFPFMAVISVLIFYASRQVFMGATDIATMSTNARYEMWDLALHSILENPLAGLLGFGMHTSNAIVNWRGGASIDSFFIGVLIDQGIIGFILFLWIYFFTVYLAIKLWWQKDFKDMLPIFIVLAMSGYMVIAFISSLWHSLHLYFLLIAVVWILSLIEKKQVFNEKNRNYHSPL